MSDEVENLKNIFRCLRADLQAARAYRDRDGRGGQQTNGPLPHFRTLPLSDLHILERYVRWAIGDEA